MRLLQAHTWPIPGPRHGPPGRPRRRGRAGISSRVAASPPTIHREGALLGPHVPPTSGPSRYRAPVAHPRAGPSRHRGRWSEQSMRTAPRTKSGRHKPIDTSTIFGEVGDADDDDSLLPPVGEGPGRGGAKRQGGRSDGATVCARPRSPEGRLKAGCGSWAVPWPRGPDETDLMTPPGHEANCGKHRAVAA